MQYITLKYTIQYKNTIIQIEKNKTKLDDQIKQKRKETKQNQQYNRIHNTTTYNTIEYNQHYISNRETPNETERNESKEKPDETKSILIKSNQHYNTTNNSNT